MKFTDVQTASFYLETTVANLNFGDPIKFVDNKTGKPFKSTGIAIANDGTGAGNDLLISFGKDLSGADVIDGRIKVGEIIVFDRRIEEEIRFKKVVGDVPIRLWVW